MALFDSGMNVLLIMLGFGMLIFVHELGHFLAAKWAGIRTEGFSIGFGPPICTWRKGIGFRMGSTAPAVLERTGQQATQLRDDELASHGIGETEYALRWLPLGGFVKMLGQDDVDPSATSTSPRSFNRTPIGRRMIVISAGVVMNLLFAAVLFIIAFTAGVRFEAPVIGQVSPGSPAATAVASNGADLQVQQIGFKSGDRILAIDDVAVTTFGDVQIATAMGRPDQQLHITVERSNVDEPLQFNITPVKNEVSGLLGIGVAPAFSMRLADDDEIRWYVESNLRQSGLAAEGLKPGMTMETLAGVKMLNWEAYQSASADSNGTPLMSTWSDVDTEGTVSGEVDIALSPDPQWQMMYEVGASPALARPQPGVLGLAPLVEVRSLTDTSPNVGILAPGDVILRIGNQQAPRMLTFRETIPLHGAGEIPMSILRDGKRIEVKGRIADTGILDPRPMMGIDPIEAWGLPRIAQPMMQMEVASEDGASMEIVDTPVSNVGLLGGSRVTGIDGVAIDSWEGIWRGVHAAAAAKQSAISLDIESPTPGQEPRTVSVPLDAFWSGQVANLGWNASLHYTNFDPLYVVRHSDGNPIRAVSMGLQETAKLVVLTYLTIDRLFRGTVGVEQLHGPVGIVHLGSKVADRGFTYLLFFLGLISVNLAVINFLPLPIVDGGLFLYLIYEKFKGRPPSVGFQNGAALVGLMLIATAFVVTFYNDILRLVG